MIPAVVVLGAACGVAAGHDEDVDEHCLSAEDYDVPTADGASVHLHRHPAPGPPVVLVHGISSNHHAWDLSERRSLAVALAEAGLDAWLLDLRGHGDAVLDAGGHLQRSGWSVDDYGRYDLPAAIDFVREATGAARVGYVGHSMGGMVAAVYNAWHGDDALAALVVVGSPIDFSNPDPLLAWTGRSMGAGTLLPRIHTPALARVAASLNAAPFMVDDLLFDTDNMQPDARAEMYREVVSPLSRQELRQFSRIVRSGRFTSVDGEIDYLEALAELDTPLMAIAGRADRVAPPDRIRPWVDRAGSSEARWVLAGIANGFAHDYGHLDLAMGDTAAAEIYPLIVGWMQDHQAAPPAEASPAPPAEARR